MHFYRILYGKIPRGRAGNDLYRRRLCIGIVRQNRRRVADCLTPIRVVTWSQIAFLMLLSFVPATAALAGAQEYTDPAVIQRTANDYIARQVQALYSRPAHVEVAAPDPRLRLPVCKQVLEIFSPPGSHLLGNVHVGVRCPGMPGWSLYLTAKISVWDTVLIAARPLMRGQVLRLTDFTPAKLDLASLPAGYLTQSQEVAGKWLRQPVAAGTPLTGAMMEASSLVRRGEPVAIIAGIPGLEVRVAGIALMDGAPGQWVDVRNLATKRILKATVTAAGVVKVPM